MIGGACQHKNIARIYDCVYRPGDRGAIDTQDGMKPCGNGTLYLVQARPSARQPEMHKVDPESGSSLRL